MAISSNGKFIVAGSEDAKVFLFNKDNSNPLWTYGTWEADIFNWVRTVAISSDGRYIAAGSGNGNVYLFDRTFIPVLQTIIITSVIAGVAIITITVYLIVRRIRKKRKLS